MLVAWDARQIALPGMTKAAQRWAAFVASQKIPDAAGGGSVAGPVTTTGVGV